MRNKRQRDNRSGRAGPGGLGTPKRLRDRSVESRRRKTEAELRCHRGNRRIRTCAQVHETEQGGAQERAQNRRLIVPSPPQRLPGMKDDPPERVADRDWLFL